jgi:nicotinamide phosphoribosyltransferase
VLHPKVRVIQGDGIDFEMLGQILHAMHSAGWSADNIAFGSGGGLLQKLNRDTQRFAFKCSAIVVNGQERDVFKRPVTGRDKLSKPGRLKLIQREGRLVTISRDEPGDDLLVPVFRNGEVLQTWSLGEIRGRASL